MQFNIGFKALYTYLNKVESDAVAELATLEERLNTNDREQRLFGSSESTRNERSQIIHSLNIFSIKYCGISFNDLCSGVPLGDAELIEDLPKDANMIGVSTTTSLPSRRSTSVTQQVVLLLHGIRTQGDWQEMVAAQLEQGETIIVFPIRFGYLDVFRFWCPLFTRNEAISRVLREIRTAKVDYPNHALSIVAHSFGTYAISRILKENPDIELFRLILCGGIVSKRFRWDMLRGQIQDKPVINDCGKRDIWPVLAQSTTWGYGATGTFGCGTILVRDRFHNYSHGDYFEQDFVKRYWVPFIKEGTFVPSEFERMRQPTPWWMSILSILPLKYLIVVALLVLILFSMRSVLGV